MPTAMPLVDLLKASQEELDFRRGSGRKLLLPVNEVQSPDNSSTQPSVMRRIYNVSAPLEVLVEGELRLVIFGRAEPEGQVKDSQVRCFFIDSSLEHGYEDLDFPVLCLEDPAVAYIGDEIVLSGIHVEHTPEGTLFRTAFYKGRDLHCLEKFAESPFGQKDNRLLQLSSGQILLLTRPMGGEAGLGNIGVKILNSLEELTSENIMNAILLKNIFHEDEWGGANHLYELQNGWIGVLGHIAYRDKKTLKRTYCGITFELEPNTLETHSYRIVAHSSLFRDIKPWIKDLPSAIFPGGFVTNDANFNSLTFDVSVVKLITGVNDNGPGIVTIKYPFSDALLRPSHQILTATARHL
jgi:Protein of unknown function (DUF1861)